MSNNLLVLFTRHSFVFWMKNTIKHIISLCVLLLFCNGSLFVHSSTQTTSQDQFRKTEIEHLFRNQSNIANPVKEFHRKKAIVVDNEEEDSEITVSKKNLEKNYSFISFFKQQPTKFLVYHFNNSFAFSKDLPYLPSYASLYIIFEVFRI